MGIAYITVSCVFERAYKSLNLAEFNSSIFSYVRKRSSLGRKIVVFAVDEFGEYIIKHSILSFRDPVQFHPSLLT